MFVNCFDFTLSNILPSLNKTCLQVWVKYRSLLIPTPCSRAPCPTISSCTTRPRAIKWQSASKDQRTAFSWAAPRITSWDPSSDRTQPFLISRSTASPFHKWSAQVAHQDPFHPISRLATCGHPTCMDQTSRYPDP